MTPTATNGASAADHPSDIEIVERFLRLLQQDDVDGAAALLADDVVYTNVSLPTVHGRRMVRRVLRATVGRPETGFEVYVHAISQADGVVLTERTDALTAGPWRMQFWVCGRFEVQDGEITVWRDYFDWADFTVGFLRGVAGMAIPALRARPPRG
jgi:limonene-1,2-epoxide hydrolase